ncbi:alpha-galactosidase [Hoylesella loescheii]|uniref:alpha-galactosidase n=1 Tax=Hoylesella loescheii TaxID=840 RepID=UPI0028EBD591|nr:alpha-galactosidase [Hoylesella loescheii]
MKISKLLVVGISMLVGMAANAKNMISIHTDNVQLVLEVKSNGRLYQAYLGERLSEATPLSLLFMPQANQTWPMPAGNEVYPVMGTEDYFEPALQLTHNNGNPTSVLKYVSHTQNAHNGITETIVKLRDEKYPINVNLHYLAYTKEDVICQWTEISHGEAKPISLGRYASGMLYFEEPTYYLTEFSGDWAREMQMSQTQLNFGRKTIDTRLGTRAAMLAFPFFEVGLGSPVSENHGKVLMGTIGWTGNFRFTFEVDHDNQLRVLAGINPDASTYTLDRGKTFKTPEFIFTLSTQGTGQGSRNFQRWALNHRLYMAQEDRMTLLNNWENTYFDFDEQKLNNLFGQAKNLGVDLFLLDDGWFGNRYPRNNDKAGLGDWQANRAKLPGGIPALVKGANEQGVDFGIWIEPEMVNPESELARKKPHWILRLPDREPYLFRHQLVLDLTNPEVQDFVFGVIDGLMKENPNIKFMKWDCNSPITNIFSPHLKARQGNLYVDYVRGLYAVLNRVQTRYPKLYMMLCSGGGGRCDFEALKYFTEFWCSDNTDPVERIYIQWAFSHFMPAKAICSHVTDWNKKASVKFRLDVDFSCKLGFDLDLKHLSADDLAYCQAAIKEYNRLKPVIFSPNLYRLVSPYETNHCALMRVNDNQTHALLFAYDLHPRYGETIINTRLQGLDPTATYRVREICLMPGQESRLPFHNQAFTGDYLHKVGLKVLGGNQLDSRIIELVKE